MTAALPHPGAPAPLMTRTLRLLLPALLLAGALAPAAVAQDKVGTTAAQFLGLGLGARATAMGGASVASVEGPSALYWNPSAITGIQGNAAEFSQASWFVDTRLQHAGVVIHTRLFHLGIAVTNLDYGETEVTTIGQPDGTGELWGASDLAVGVTLARALTDRFSIGGTLKLVRQQVWNESAQGGAFDLGVTYDTGFQGIRLGMSMTNFGTNMRLAGPDLRRAISAAPNQPGSNDRIGASLEVDDWPMPLVFRVGISAVPFQAADQRVVVSAVGNAPSDQAQSASFGAEYAFRELVFLRAGWREAFAFNDDDGWTVGFGLRYAFDRRLAGSFDYSFQNYEPFGTPQMFTLGLSF
jgi:hypothetical protein